LVWLGEPAANEIELVGAKAANLGKLAQSHRVPPGFCLTAAALAGGYDDLEELPESLYRDVVQAYTKLADRCGEAEPAVAVRSSAIDEDSGSASFAGQHDTYLNIRGAESVARSIARCWRSLYSPRALEYRRQRGVALDGARLAVLVQKLVIADASAVVFSANPITKSRDQVMLNATWGLGESLVGGSVSPDSYMLRKSDLAFEFRYIATKRRMTVLAADGTQEVDVPERLQTAPAIDERQVVEAVQLTLELERRFGWPVDVECAWEKEILYVLQCRPITTL
jgi:phosphoenolpyruvate synthase/pyruvate phosphate dikinase